MSNHKAQQGAEKPNECPNLGIGDKRGVGMDAKRAKRFYSAMCRMNRAVISLNAAANTFPRIDLDADQMDPATTVRAICRPVAEDINLLFQMIENEDAPEEQKGGGGVGTLGQQEVASMLAAFGQMSASHQTSIYSMIHNLAATLAANKLDGRTA